MPSVAKPGKVREASVRCLAKGEASVLLLLVLDRVFLVISIIGTLAGIYQITVAKPPLSISLKIFSSGFWMCLVIVNMRG